MQKFQFPLFVLLLTSACTSSGPVERHQEPDVEAIARALVCSYDEIPFCVDAHCQPADYYCVERSRVLGTIFPGAK